jgi:hypothetical protein
MGFVQTLRRWLGHDEIDPAAAVGAEAEAKRIAYDRDSVRVSQTLQGRGFGSDMTPTPDVLHPDQHDR